jgi:choline dehydrogenase-like flavoprotein
VGGNSKVYGASLPRFREADFGVVEHHEGVSPAWPFTYADLEPYYAEAERIYRVHGATGEDPTEPWRSSPYPHPALEHEPYVEDLATRLRALGVHPSANAMGVDRGPTGGCIRCGTCDGFPCRVGAKSDAETCAIDPALAETGLRLATGDLVRRVVTDGPGRRVSHLVVEGPDGLGTVRGNRFVLAAGAVNSAAPTAGLGRRRRTPAGSRTRRARWAQLHDAQQRPRRRARPGPAERRRLPEDVVGQRLVRRRRRRSPARDDAAHRPGRRGDDEELGDAGAAPWLRPQVAGAAWSGWSCPRTCPAATTA